MIAENLLILAAWYLAVARVTVLINQDRITEDIRIRFMHWVGVNSMLAYLINCAWCVSIWVGLFSTAVPVFMADRTWPQAVLLALGASYFTGIMSGLTGEDIAIDETDG